jgi:hypothetical protein
MLCARSRSIHAFISHPNGKLNHQPQAKNVKQIEKDNPFTQNDDDDGPVLLLAEQIICIIKPL